MDASTARALRAINRRFYARSAPSFVAKRDHPWPGWDRLVGHLPPVSPLRVLDVGCGHGRFGVWLAGRGTKLDYAGVDAEPRLLAAARPDSRLTADARLCEWDVLECTGPEPPPPGPHDLVVAFGLLHHVPGRAAREWLVRWMAERLAPGGRLVVTLWRFAQLPRFADRRVPWSVPAATGVDPAELEPGDWLLSWDGDPEQVRYCHHAGEPEIERLIRASGLRLVERFAADGREGALNTYLVLAAS